MRTRNLFVWLALGMLTAIVVTGLWLPALQTTQAAPDVFASPIHVGCTQPVPGVCKLHVDPFTIQVDGGNRLQAFQLHANGELIYDYRTDVSNPPVGSYSPSLVKLDFAAVCGRTYTVNLLARDSGNANFLNAGQAEEIVCPVIVYPGSILTNPLMLPLIFR